MAGQTIDVRIEHGVSRLESPFPENVSAAATVPWRHADRGPVRLVIDMPARTGKLVLAMSALCAVLAVLVLAVVALVRIAFGVPLSSALNSGFVVAVILGAAAMAVVQLSFMRAGAARETLEIDSRFISLSRAGQLVGLWGRAQAGEFVSWSAPTERWRAWISRWLVDRPTISWGSADYPGWTGAGISDAAADSLLERIASFCRDNPPDPGFEFHPGSIPMQGTANKRIQRMA